MARKVETYVRIIDDLDGTPLPLGEGETVNYGMDGVEYEIDLSADHAEQFRTMLQTVIEKSRRTGGRRISAPRKAKAIEGAPPAPGAGNGERLPYAERMARREMLREVRAFGIAQGFPQGMTGKIRDDVRQAWNAAHPDRPVPEEAPRALTQ